MDSVIHSIALSSLLIEVLEDLEAQKVLLRKPKQVAKQFKDVLEKEYISKVFSKDVVDGQELLDTVNIVEALKQKLYKVLREESVLHISDRRDILKTILVNGGVKENKAEEILKTVDKEEILNF